MGKKIALNVLYNVGIFICAMAIYWSFTNKQHYEYVLAAGFTGAILIALKIKLIKEIRNTDKKP